MPVLETVGPPMARPSAPLLDIARSLAAQAAVAIDNARLYQEVKGSEERYRDLFENANDIVYALLDPRVPVSEEERARYLRGVMDEARRLDPARDLAKIAVVERHRDRPARDLRGRDDRRHQRYARR